MQLSARPADFFAFLARTQTSDVESSGTCRGCQTIVNNKQALVCSIFYFYTMLSTSWRRTLDSQSIGLASVIIVNYRSNTMVQLSLLTTVGQLAHMLES